jgi:hypothetical protein
VRDTAAENAFCAPRADKDNRIIFRDAGSDKQRINWREGLWPQTSGFWTQKAVDGGEMRQKKWKISPGAKEVTTFHATFIDEMLG